MTGPETPEDSTAYSEGWDDGWEAAMDAVKEFIRLTEVNGAQEEM